MLYNIYSYCMPITTSIAPLSTQRVSSLCKSCMFDPMSCCTAPHYVLLHNWCDCSSYIIYTNMLDCMLYVYLYYISLYAMMAFAKTPTRLKLAVLSVRFQNWIKLQIKTIQKFSMSCPTPLFCLSCQLPRIEPGSTAELPTTLTNEPNTQVEECYPYMILKPFRTCIFQWSKFHLPIFLLSKPKSCQNVELFCISV